MNILVLETKIHHIRANIFDLETHFPNCSVTYNGSFYYNRDCSFFRQFDLVVSSVFSSVTSNLIVKKCKRYGIKTLLLTDGIIEWENMHNNSYLQSKGIKLYHPIIHDYFGVMGSLEKKYFSILNPSCTPLDFTPVRIKLGMNNPISENRKLFLLTSANNAYVNEFEKERVIEIYSQILSSFLELQIPYKLRIFDKDILNVLHSIDPSLKNDIDSSFSDCLDDVQAVITGPSSIVFEAFEKDLPVAQLLYRNAPVFTQSGWFINSYTDIKSTLLSMKNPEWERIAFQKAVLAEHYTAKNITQEINLSNFNENEKISVEEEFFKSKYVVNLEPYFRAIDDFLKCMLPSTFRKTWVNFMKKFR